MSGGNIPRSLDQPKAPGILYVILEINLTNNSTVYIGLKQSCRWLWTRLMHLGVFAFRMIMVIPTTFYALSLCRRKTSLQSSTFVCGVPGVISVFVDITSHGVSCVGYCFLHVFARKMILLALAPIGVILTKYDEHWCAHRKARRHPVSCVAVYLSLENKVHHRQAVRERIHGHSQAWRSRRGGAEVGTRSIGLQ
jgi:hypothetical protein